MKKIIFEQTNEIIYESVLSNGIRIFLYPTKKTKNFLATITVKYGAKVFEYSINKNYYNKVILGSAHFLEHKVMNFSEDPNIEFRMNELGLYANAYTSPFLTNYNIYGSNNIGNSITLLLDLFYKPNITNKNVEAEKGIIIEELEMYKNDPCFRINLQINKNTYHSSYLNEILVGEKEDIKKINKDGLLKLYKDFYLSNESFITVVGNFNIEEVISTITDYMKEIKISKPKKIKYKKHKDKDSVVVPYMEMTENISTPIVKYALKIKKSDLNISNKIIKRYYINFIFSSLLSTTSILYDEYKKESLFTAFNYDITDTDKYYVVLISAVTNFADKLINSLKEDIKKEIIDEKTFNRKKKMFISSMILNFENIEDVEDKIVGDISIHNKILNNAYNLLNKMSYKEMLNVLKCIDFSNTAILKVIPK